MRFTKMHGIGNDYVYVDCIRQPPPRDPAGLGRVVSDRHFGVGGDGLILICPSERADARMRMFNADGSESEMCGNGVRCVAKYVYDHGLRATTAPHHRNRPRRPDARPRGHATARSSRSPWTWASRSSTRTRSRRRCRGRACRQPCRMPAFRMDRALGQRRAAWSRASTCVSMGNPHAVFYCDDVARCRWSRSGPARKRTPSSRGASTSISCRCSRRTK